VFNLVIANWIVDCDQKQRTWWRLLKHKIKPSYGCHGAGVVHASLRATKDSHWVSLRS